MNIWLWAGIAVVYAFVAHVILWLMYTSGSDVERGNGKYQLICLTCAVFWLPLYVLLTLGHLWRKLLAIKEERGSDA